MSHFTTIVLVRQDAVPEPGHPDFEAKLMSVVEEMLAPFDENLDVDPYDRKCTCGEYAVNRKADKLAAEETGLNWKDLRDSYHELEVRPSWEEYTAPLREAEAYHRAELMRDVKPQADCDECHGTGSYVSTFNERAQWDWYCVGGRWDGHFQSKSPEEPDGYDIPCIIPNVAFARDVQQAAYAPFAILSPREPHQRQNYDNWNEKGSMGWFGISVNENDNWQGIANELLDKYSACFAVLMDLHI